MQSSARGSAAGGDIHRGRGRSAAVGGRALTHTRDFGDLARCVNRFAQYWANLLDAALTLPLLRPLCNERLIRERQLSPRECGDVRVTYWLSTVAGMSSLLGRLANLAATIERRGAIQSSDASAKKSSCHWLCDVREKGLATENRPVFSLLKSMTFSVFSAKCVFSDFFQ